MFARKLKYCASDEHPAFCALIELARKKGGKAERYVVYRYEIVRSCSGHLVSHAEISQVSFSGREKELAEAAFPYAFEYDWERTTSWLHPVAVGGGYRQHLDGEWVKVGRPSPWKRRRKKRKLHLRFGELGHILLVRKYELEVSLKELRDLGFLRHDLSWEEIESVLDQLHIDFQEGILEGELEEFEVLCLMVSKAEEAIKGIKNEMKISRECNRIAKDGSNGGN